MITKNSFGRGVETDVSFQFFDKEKAEEELKTRTTRKLNKRTCPLNEDLYSQNIVVHALLTCVTSDVDIGDLLNKWTLLVEKCAEFYKANNLEMPIWTRIKHMWATITSEIQMCYYKHATNFLFDLLINKLCQCSCGTYALREIMIGIDKNFANSLVYVRSPAHLQLGYRDEHYNIHIIETVNGGEINDGLLNERVQTRRTRGEVSIDDVDWTNISNFVRIINEISDDIERTNTIAALGYAMKVYRKKFTGVYRMFALRVSFLGATEDSPLKDKLHEKYLTQRDKCLQDLQESEGSIDAWGSLDLFFDANIEKKVDHRRWYKKEEEKAEAKERAASKMKTYKTLEKKWGKKGKSKSTKRKLSG